MKFLVNVSFENFTILSIVSVILSSAHYLSFHWARSPCLFFHLAFTEVCSTAILE